MLISKPDPSEYLPYQIEYVRRVPNEDVLGMLTQQIEESLSLLRTLTEEQVMYRPAPAEWNIKEIIGHIADTERVFAYRALCFARGDQSPLPGFEQDDYVAAANFSARTLADLCDEFAAVRQATLTLFHSFTPEIFLRKGTANNTTSSVRAWVYCSAGHEHHHMESIRTVYLERGA
ncbi:MAG: DinB family protein [Caldilineaceae bacterium]|nr:DinB family protein [Caldilineaceae bacterium]